MSSANPAPAAFDLPATADPYGAMITGAQRRLAMLGRLAELGMQLAEGLARRAAAAADDSEPKHDPAESFARASRAVRLALALEARFEQDLAGLREAAAAASAAATTVATTVASTGDPLARPPLANPRRLNPRDHPSTHRNRIRDNVRDVMNHEITDIFPAQEMLDDLHERLTEGERYDSLLYRPLRESVEAICNDLGLTPDWSRWTEDGFPPETRTTRRQWSSFWAPDPSRAKARRLETAEKKGLAAQPPDPHRRD